MIKNYLTLHSFIDALCHEGTFRFACQQQNYTLQCVQTQRDPELAENTTTGGRRVVFNPVVLNVFWL